MKLTIGEFTVEVKAKNTALSERNNLMDTITFLNRASIACDRAAEVYDSKGYPALAEIYRKMGSDIYAALTAAGAYKDL